MKKNKSEYEFLNLLGRFITEYLPVSANASKNTVSSYKCAFRLLFQYLEEQKGTDISQVTFEMLDFDLLTGFFDWLVSDRKNSRTTAKQRMGRCPLSQSMHSAGTLKRDAYSEPA